MNYKLFTNCVLTITLLLCALLNIQAQDVKDEVILPPGENVVLQWNRVLQETLKTPGQQPATIFPVRSFAMMHAAMFDAVNSIDGRYTTYWTNVLTTKDASADAAAAKAARDVLAALYPTRIAIFDAELANSIVGIPANRVQHGMGVGEIVAAQMLLLRANDGWNVTPPPYILPMTPGNWQPIAPSTAAGFTHYPNVLPFAIGSGTRFALNPPPTMTSEQYTLDFNEVKEIGSLNSTTRTADQTKVAQLWANVNTPTVQTMVWNNVARTIAIRHNNTTAENARLFALLNISNHDALQTTVTSKFQYGLWRPLTAIRRADEDGNPNTTQDAVWTSLLTNPPYPTYGGNNAAVGTSMSTILALCFGRDDIPFQHTWDGTGGATRSYVGLTALADEEANSRIYGGIHFRFDNVAGQSAGRNVANFVFLNFMKPRSNK